MEDQPNEFARITLTPAQRDQIKRITGREGDAIELTVEELEERIISRLASNHNEPLLRA